LLALCDWQTGEGSGTRGRILLDELAVGFGDFQLNEPDKEQSEAAALARYLFEYKGLRGSDTDDFYNPLNSNLVHTLETGRGLPITLACVFILVGRRVGLDIGGCPFPGHFLARDEQGEQVFDPFNGGRILSPREIGALIKAAPHEMTSSASAREIVGRVLRNLSVAYHQSGDSEKSGAMLSMLRLMDGD
jgi:regulator of sirC expression with transglutaminase-like and TPR domain